MKFKKKWMAIVLMVSMILTMLPMTAFAAETTTVNRYVRLVNHGTETAFVGAEMISAYYSSSEKQLSFEKVSDGVFKVAVDASINNEFIIFEFEFPEDYRQVGYDIEPMGRWAETWITSNEDYIIEVCNKENGYGTEIFEVFAENQGGSVELLEGATVTAFLYGNVNSTNREPVTIGEGVNGSLTFDYEYEHGNFVYNGNEYKDLCIYVEYPFGYRSIGKQDGDLASEEIWYTVDTFAGHNLDSLYAEQYLEDLSITAKDVYVELVDSVTGERFLDAELLGAVYAENFSDVTYPANMEKVSDGLYKVQLNGEIYKNCVFWAYFQLPEGHILQGHGDVAEWPEYVSRWFVNGEKITINVINQNETNEPNEGPVFNENIIYEILDKNGDVLNNGSMKVWVSDTVGEGAEMTLIYESTDGYSQIPIEYNYTEFLYNGEGYNFIIYECQFPTGYSAYYVPKEDYIEPAYISGGMWYYNVVDLSAENFTWSWTLVKEDEKNETEPMEETFTYEFVDVNGLGVVPGTNVVISLCNEMESNDKVVIAGTTTGEGTFTVSHMGDFYYYDDETYNYLEISYRFPEGYILADSEGVTENTVWYSVENLCDGSNEITWFLEKVSEDESEDTTNDIKDVIVEDTDTSKEVTEKLDNVIKESQKGDKVKVEVPKDANVGKDAFETAKEKEVAVIIVSNKNEKNDYVQWNFETIDNPVEFNPTVHVDAKVDEIEKKLEHFEMPKDCKHTVVSFEFAGVLPGKAEVTLDMEDTGLEIETLEEGKLVYLYFFNPETKSFELVDSSKVLEGYVTFSMIHCSDYIVTTELLAEDASDDKDDINVPTTGDNTVVELYGVILLLGVGCILMSKKRNMMV